jgi:hypothetical protein
LFDVRAASSAVNAQPCRGLFQAAFDPYRPRIQIDSSPREAADFTAAHSSGNRERGDRVQGMALDPAQGVGDLIGCQDRDFDPLHLRWRDRMRDIPWNNFESNRPFQTTM